MSQLLHLGEIVAMNARLFPDKPGGRDLTRSMTFRQWNERACRLANALIGLGLAKGDRVAVLAYNCLEWLEIYAAVAKAGLVAVPGELPAGRRRNPLHRRERRSRGAHRPGRPRRSRGGNPRRPAARRRPLHPLRRRQDAAGYRSYEDADRRAPRRASRRVASARTIPSPSSTRPGPPASPRAPSAATASLVLHAYLNQIDFGFGRDDLGLLVMPMCHANSHLLHLRLRRLRRRPAASTTGRASTRSTCCGRSPATGSPSPRWCRPTTS